MSPVQSPPGWHGKLPSLGDFASRRLDTEFVEAWDAWLASGMLALRESNPVGWLDAYLAGPSWRFLLMPGVLGGMHGRKAWAGVLMPSVDRVGRYFPFTIVQPLEDGPASTQQMHSLWHWLGRLDELAADALQDDWNVERLEAELAHMAPPGCEPLAGACGAQPGAAGALAEMVLAPGTDAAAAIGIEAQALWSRHAAGLAYWYASAETQPPRLLLTRGLPRAAQALLGATI